MKYGWRKGISFALIIGLLLSLFQPWPLPVQANTNEYFYFDNLSVDYDDPTKVNASRIEVAGTFHPSVSTSSISYRVDILAVKNESGTTFESKYEIIGTIDGTGAMPIIAGNKFRFMNIELGQGLNRITITGTSSNGNAVSASAYAYFSNVPAIYDVQLVDGTPLLSTEPAIVNSNMTHIMMKAPNATSVTVNGQAAFTADGITYLATNLPLTSGLNTMTIVSYNETMTYTVTREIVYFNIQGPPMLYGVEVFRTGGNPEVTPLDGVPTVGPNNGANALAGAIRGNVLYEYNSSYGTLTPTIRIDIHDEDGNLVYQENATTVTRDVYNSTSGYVGFSFITPNNLSISDNGKYTLTVTSDYDTDASYPLVFNFRDSNSPYITEVYQVYSVQENGTDPITYGSRSVFANNTTLMELPVWFVVNGKNIQSTTVWELEVWQNGEPINLPNESIEEFKVLNDANAVAFKVNHLPSGDLEFRFLVDGDTDHSTVFDDRRFAVTYVPAPSIVFTNVYNGKIFKGNYTGSGTNNNPDLFSNIRGRVVNFTNAADLNTLTITINGSSHSLTVDPATHTFDFKAVGAPNNITLAPGANTIAVSGTASGIPVTTTITVYLMTDDVPIITSLRPVPYNELSEENSDPNQRFISTEFEYVTNESKADILFTVQNVDSVLISVDGRQIWKRSGTNLATLEKMDPNATSTFVIDDDSEAAAGKFDLRLRGLELPQSGVTSIVITATKGSGTAQRTLMIRREVAPYILLSPKLPNERVINQNFLNIIIKAEGADQIEIDKQLMVKDENDIFRYEKKDLRKGVNKIKFTVIRGEERLNGEFEVNYVEQLVPGAQFKTTVGRNKLKLFGGQLEIEFPRNTLLQTPEMEPRPGLYFPPTNVELFDKQEMLFGIANKQDGRTITRYNDDGVLVPISGSMLGLLQRPRHFGFASELYWTDAGYFDTSSSEYVTVSGMHPYENGNEFFTRYTATSTRHLQPTNRGTITIKYDDSIVNAASNRLGIWRWVDNGWKPLGGKVDTKKKTVTAPFDGFGYYAVFQLRDTFNDIAGHPYAREELNLMFSQGVMKNKNPVEFGVYDHISRGEFATMLVKILDLPLNFDPNNLSFDDVPNVINDDWLWDYRYIETAARAGIIDGRRPRIFMPNDTLTREEAATMMARAMNLKLGEYDREIARLQKDFTDANSIFYYAVPAVSAVVREKIMQGIPNTQPEGTFRFEPKSNLNRADAAIMAKRVMEKLKKL